MPEIKAASLEILPSPNKIPRRAWSRLPPSICRDGRRPRLYRSRQFSIIYQWSAEGDINGLAPSRRRTELAPDLLGEKPDTAGTAWMERTIHQANEPSELTLSDGLCHTPVMEC